MTETKTCYKQKNNHFLKQIYEKYPNNQYSCLFMLIFNQNLIKKENRP